MSENSFFQKKEAFDRGVAEVRALLGGKDPATLGREACARLAQKYEALSALSRELCELSRTSSSKEQYQSLAVRLGERGRTMQLIASGKSIKATPDEQRKKLLSEFEKRYQDIKKKLKGRKPQSLSAGECEALSKKYEKLAHVAQSIAEVARTDTDEKKYRAFYEKLMCRAAELTMLVRKKTKSPRVDDAPKAGAKKPSPEVGVRDERADKVSAFQSLSLAISTDYARLLALTKELQESSITDADRESYEYFARYLSESAEFYEAVMKKEIKTLSPEEILNLETKY